MKKQAGFVLIAALQLACSNDSSYYEGPLRLGTVSKPAFAVELLEGRRSAVGLLDAAGAVIRDEYLTSSETLDGARLAASFSLPSNPELDGVLSVINGRPRQNLLRIDYFNGVVLADGPLGSADEANIGVRDYLYVDEKHGWVTRYDPNLDEGAKGFALGDDLVLLEPGSGELAKRIDLSALYEEVTYVNLAEDEERTATAYARPSKLVGLVGGYAYVGLDRSTLDEYGFAPGAGLILDVEKAKVSTIELDDLRGCGEVAAVIGERDAVIVSCAGAPGMLAETSGFAYVVISKGKGEVKHVLRLPGEAPLTAFSSAISLGGTRFATAQRGPDEDVLLIADFASEELVEIERFDMDTFGYAGAYQPEAKLLLLPDRASNRILRFRVDGKGAKADGSFGLDSELTVRAIFPLERF